jgi:hypothetical protein
LPLLTLGVTLVLSVPTRRGHVIVTGTPTFLEDDGNGRSELSAARQAASSFRARRYAS